MKEKLAGMVQVGKVRDSHGLKGELFVVTSLDTPPAWVEKFTDFTLVYQNPTEKGKHEENSKTFKVKKTRPHKKGFIVKTDEIENRNESDLYIGAAFYIDEKYTTSQKGEGLYLREVKGFTVVANQEAVGKITSFSSNGAQDLLVVQSHQGVVEIPFIQNFVEKIDFEDKKVHMNLPSGLLDLDPNESPDDKDD